MITAGYGHNWVSQQVEYLKILNDRRHFFCVLELLLCHSVCCFPSVRNAHTQTDIHGSQRMYPNNFGDPLTCHLISELS